MKVNSHKFDSCKEQKLVTIPSMIWVLRLCISYYIRFYTQMCFAVWVFSELNYKQHSSTGDFDIFLMNQWTPIGRRTTYMNAYLESTSKFSQKQLFQNSSKNCNESSSKKFAEQPSIVVKLLLIYNEFLPEYISRIWTRDETGNFIDQLFFKSIYFPEPLSLAMPIKFLKAMINATAIKFQSLTHPISCTRSVAYLELSQTSKAELYSENS